MMVNKEADRTKKFSFISLFAGIGGFDLGLERAGMICKQQVEIDNRCNEVLTHHWPDVQRLGDVRDVGRHNLGAVDLITGGFPCQDVSVAGKRAGLAGERSGLWFEFHRILEELRPRWVVVENVPGLLSSNGGQDFAVILRGLVELGYGVCWRVFDAQYDGVAQQRRRVFVVGSLGDGCAAEVLFERESSAWDPPPGRETGTELAPTLAPGPHPGGVTGREAESGMIVQHAPSAHNQRNDPDGEHFVVAYQCHGSNVGPMGTLRRGDGSIQSGVPFVARPLAHSQTTNHYDESQQTYVISRDAVPKTAGGKMTDLRAGNPHISAVFSGMGVRRLTPTECERLQGFPDGWTTVNGMSDSARYRMLGNAVCVPVAGWIGRRIIEVGSENG